MRGGVDTCRPVYTPLRSTPSVYTLDRAASISSGLTLPGGREDGGLAQVIADQAGPQGWR